ncbi:MAG TPA: hypothetical protein VHF90_04470 [Thermoleophilaceae bacterium]|nr:hypothetical protein [Thermoleophilaceae bacterium]
MTAGLAAGVGGLAAAAVAPSEALATTSGKTIIAGEESRSSTAFGLLSTPDQVTNIDVPTNGKLRISYLAAWKGDTENASITAAIFLGSDQLMSASAFHAGLVTPSEGSASIGIFHGKYSPLRTSADGLTVQHVSVVTTFSGYPTTGVIVSQLEAFVATGTYTVSVQFKASAGSVSVKDRRLWVEAVAY